MLVWELARLGIVRRHDLEVLLDRHLQSALVEDGEIACRKNERGGGGELSDHFFTHTGLLNTMLEKEFGVGFHSIIFERVEAELKRANKGLSDRRLTEK